VSSLDKTAGYDAVSGCVSLAPKVMLFPMQASLFLTTWALLLMEFNKHIKAISSCHSIATITFILLFKIIGIGF
jgi:hypothetical protein